MTEGQKGVLAIAGAATIWGLSGIFYKALWAVPPLEVLSHRTIWSAVFLGALLVLQGRAGEIAGLMRRPVVWATLAVTATLIAANWLGFIYSVQSGRALEASLGYYIFPLFAVALGYLVLGERFSRVQSVAIAMAALAVVVLTIGIGHAPWMALMLAATFSGYGLFKNRIAIGPRVSVLMETLILAPFALVWLWGMHAGRFTDIGGRSGGVFGHDPVASLLLVCSGPLTGGPLVLLAYAASRIPYATLGLVQYLNPTLQFLVAVALFGETFTTWHAIAFPLIWGGLALYSWDSLRRAAGTAAVTRPRAGP